MIGSGVYLLCLKCETYNIFINLHKAYELDILLRNNIKMDRVSMSLYSSESLSVAGKWRLCNESE